MATHKEERSFVCFVVPSLLPADRRLLSGRITARLRLPRNPGPWHTLPVSMHFEVQVTPNEARVLGVLIEKAFTTPDQYPLTCNAVTIGANQKSNREPVLSLSEDETLAALEGLETKHLVRRVFPENSRVEKYSQWAREMLVLPAESLAVLAELLMRGPQTPGELRARASRMRRMESTADLMNALAPAIERGYATRLPPAPGSRAERYGQLLCPEAHRVEVEESAPSGPGPGLTDRVAGLETEVERLRRQLEGLATRLGQPLDE